MAVAPKIAGYDVIQCIGGGSFGQCYKVKRQRDNTLMALKAIRYKNQREKDMIVQEIILLYKLDYPYILKYYDNIVDTSQQIIGIFTEFYLNGDLDGRINDNRSKNEVFREDGIWKTFCQLTLALRFCHRNKVIHRDIKPCNIFLKANGDVVLGDFGVSRILSANTRVAHTVAGTLGYSSPEMLGGEGYTEKTDVWSLGCVIYELSCLVRPYHDVAFGNLMAAMKKRPPKPIPARYSQLLHFAIKHMLHPKASRRPAIKDFTDSPSLAPKYQMWNKT